jgi:anti-sigma B factor antagonist
MGFSVKAEKKGDIGVITLEGEVDMFTSPNLRDKLVALFKQGVKAIVVDLSLVSFMDSSGIATLVEGLQWSRKKNKAFVLTGLGTNVMNALCLTKLDQVFSIEIDTDTAVKGLNG